MECPQRHRATSHHLTQWRVTELYGVQWRRRGEANANIVYSMYSDGFFDRVEVQRRWHMLPARRPCNALLGHRVRKWNGRNVIARSITA